MKKINVLIIAVITVAAAFMTSCKNDPIDFAAPTVTFTEGDQAVNANTAVSVSGVVFAAADLKHVIAKKKIVSSGTVTTLEEVTKFDNDTIYNFKYDFTEADVTESFTVEVEATDKNDKTISKSVTITVHQGQPVVKHAGLKLYTASNDQYTDELSFASLTDFTTYSWSTAAANVSNIDLLYYNGNYTKATSSVPHFASPDFNTTDPIIIIHNDEAPAGAKTTYFAVLTGDDAALFADWDNISDDSGINSIDAAIDQTNVTWTDADGTLIAFKLADGKKGVIRTGVAVDGNNNTYYYDPSYDYITFDVIVQEQAPVTK